MTAKKDLSKEPFQAVQNLIRNKLGSQRSIAEVKSVSGGCAAEAFQTVLDDGTNLFVKVSAGQDNRFDAERDGLEALRSTNTISVAQVVASETNSSTDILVLEWIESTSPQSDFWPRFGHQLAQLHLANRSIDQFGFSQNNLIGASKQPNRWTSEWPEFFAEFRLAFQGDLALKQNLINTSQRKKLDRLIGNLPQLLASDDVTPALLHGDLWSGNFLCDSNQNPVLFDPAVYYGHHECEFGITTLFGGFASAFFEAYHDVIPKDACTAQRIEIYQLYHLLNHLNLFGGSYWSACQAILSKYT